MKKSTEELVSSAKVIDITEVFNTTPARLFKAWTDEKDFAAWFGPEGFESVSCSLDVSVGGKWRAGISNESGDQYWMEGKYLEIVKNRRLVFTFNDGSENKRPDQETIVIVTFSKSGDQTIMSFNQSVFKTVESKDGHLKGWSSGFVCLRKHIGKSEQS